MADENKSTPVDLVMTFGDGDDERSIVAKRPKFALLKKVMRVNRIHNEDPDNFQSEEGFATLFQLIVDIFDNPELTIDNIEEANLDSYLSLQDINDWMNRWIPQKKMIEAKQVDKMKSRQKAAKKS